MSAQDSKQQDVLPDWIIHLEGVQCSHGDTEALHKAESYLEHAPTLCVWIPDIQSVATTDYALDGYIYVEQNRTLNEMMVEAGYGVVS